MSFYKILFHDGLTSCNLPDSKDYAYEFARLMILCGKQPVAFLRITKSTTN